MFEHIPSVHDTEPIQGPSITLLVGLRVGVSTSLSRYFVCTKFTRAFTILFHPGPVGHTVTSLFPHLTFGGVVKIFTLVVSLLGTTESTSLLAVDLHPGTVPITLTLVGPDVAGPAVVNIPAASISGLGSVTV
jgi:hypothetical protein